MKLKTRKQDEVLTCGSDSIRFSFLEVTLESKETVSEVVIVVAAVCGGGFVRVLRGFWGSEIVENGEVR